MPCLVRSGNLTAMEGPRLIELRGACSFSEIQMRQRIKKYPSKEGLVQILDYNPDSGELIWKKRTSGTFSKRLAGRNAGMIKVDKHGNTYRVMDAAGVSGLLAHRVAWIIHYGSISPQARIDHRDGNGLNNSIGNLRIATQAQNAKNLKVYSNNSTGVPGVYGPIKSRRGLYKARLTCDGKPIHLGYHKTLEAAALARKEGERLYFKEFRRGG